MLIGFGVAVVCLVAVVLQSVRHPVPLLDLPSLRVPTLWLSCLAMLLFATAFGSMLFGNVLFLTDLWHESVIVAGLWLAPGPLMVVVVSLTVGGRLVNRLGPGPVAAMGGLLFAIGATIWLLRLGPAPDYVGGLLPGQPVAIEDRLAAICPWLAQPTTQPWRLAAGQASAGSA